MALINGWSVQVFDEMEQYGYIRYHITKDSQWLEAFIKKTPSGTLRFAHGFAPAGSKRERIRSGKAFHQRLRGDRPERELRGLLTQQELIEAGAVSYAERPNGEKIYTPHPGVVDVGYSIEHGQYMGVSLTWPHIMAVESRHTEALARIMEKLQKRTNGT